MDPDVLSSRLVLLRDAGLVTLLVRLAILVGAAAALGAIVVAPWDAPDALVVVALVAVAACVGLPDSPAALGFSLAIVGSFAMRAGGEIDGHVIVAALGVLVVHVASALAAATPLPSRVTADALRRWAVPTAALAGVTVLAALVLVALTAWGPAGSLAMTIGALALIAALALRWSSVT